MRATGAMFRIATDSNPLPSFTGNTHLSVKTRENPECAQKIWPTVNKRIMRWLQRLDNRTGRRCLRRTS